jgi:hypothetical protein
MTKNQIGIISKNKWISILETSFYDPKAGKKKSKILKKKKAKKK